MVLNELPIAVLDTETTGVLRHSDRVIEVAVINCRPNGEIEDEFVTLINPKRDLGNASIHGIRASDVRQAPEFHEVAGDISERLAGRVIVGHNIQFDLGLLAAEYERLNTTLPQPPSLCTLKLAYKFGPQSRKLSDCCTHFGITHHHAHSALDDAKATLHLLRSYLGVSKQPSFYKLMQLMGAPGEPNSIWPSLARSGKSFKRTANDELKAHSFLSSLIQRLPEAGTAEIASYFALLDRALEDRKFSDQEIAELTQLAIADGLSQSGIKKAHEEYLQGLIYTALQDGVITDSEMRDISLVASLLGFDSQVVSETINGAQQSGSAFGAPRIQNIHTTNHQLPQTNALTGKTVCFTGSMICLIDGKPISRELAQELATQKGLVPVPSVTKKTNILVMADPDSMSGKAKKAEAYGTRVIAERAFWKMIGVAAD